MQESTIPTLQSDLGSTSAAKRWGWFLFAASPALIPLYFLLKYHVNFIWADAWDLAEILVRSHQHTLSISDFWALHNEHRLPIPYLIMFVLAKLTHWNTLVEVIFGYVMVCLNSALLALLLQRGASRGNQPSNWVWQWFLINLLIFSPIQVENWTFGFAACQNFIPVPCIVGAILLLDRRTLSWRNLLLCGLLIEIASLSQANGLLGWFLIFPFILSGDMPSGNLKRKHFISCWLGMAAASFALQFAGYEPNHLAARYYSAGGLGRIQFFLVFLGTPLNFGLFSVTPISTLVGLVLLAGFAGFIVWIFRQDEQRTQRIAACLPWLVLGFYAMGSGMMAAIGRAGIGLSQAYTSRYTTLSMYLIIALIGIIPLFKARFLKNPEPFLLGLFLIAIVWGDFRSRGEFAEAARDRRAGVAHLSFINIVFDHMGEVLVTDHAHLREYANALSELGYLHPPLVQSADVNRLMAPGSDSEAAKAKSGSVEGGHQTEDGTVNLNGWAVISDRDRLADAVLVSCETDNHEQVLCAVGDVYVHESDSVTQIGNGRPNAFWMVSFPGSRLPVGSRMILCWAYDAERQLAFPLGGLVLQTQPSGK